MMNEFAILPISMGLLFGFMFLFHHFFRWAEKRRLSKLHSGASQVLAEADQGRGLRKKQLSEALKEAEEWLESEKAKPERFFVGCQTKNGRIYYSKVCEPFTFDLSREGRAHILRRSSKDVAEVAIRKIIEGESFKTREGMVILHSSIEGLTLHSNLDHNSSSTGKDKPSKRSSK
jgi:hypothetical protein